MDARPGLSRSKTTGYAAASSYSRPTRQATTTAVPTSAKPLPGVPQPGLQRSNTTNLQRSNTSAGLGSGHTNVRYIQANAVSSNKPLPMAGGKTLPGVPAATSYRTQKPLPINTGATATRTAAPPPVAGQQYLTQGLVKRSNTTPMPMMRSNTITAGTRHQHATTTKTQATPGGRPIPQPLSTRQPQVAPQPPPKAGPLSRSKSESQRPSGQPFANKSEAVKALKAPLPAIPQGAVAKNLVLASEANARVLDSGLPNTTSSHIVRVAESNGECLKEAHRALYGRHLPVEDRIIWNRTAESDKGMKALLEWIDKVRWGLASLGLHKFVSTKSRGALVFNINGRLSNSPETPAVDWMTFDDAQKTLDHQLQTYISTYDPTAHVLVYAFRVMPGGNNLHIWGKKLTIPPSLPTTHAAEIKEALKKVNKKKHTIQTEDKLPSNEGPLLSLPFKWFKRKLSKRGNR